LNELIEFRAAADKWRCLWLAPISQRRPRRIVPAGDEFEPIVLHCLKTRLWPVDEWRPCHLLATFICRSGG
jgi:hypothetical protein